jgi:hypothetical protein
MINPGRMHPNFVAADAAGTRRDTAALLVGTAQEFNIDQHDIKSASGGFYITDRLADVLDAESDEPEVSGNQTSTKTSGDRAAKKKTQKKGK